jgi:hypothetical protein
MQEYRAPRNYGSPVSDSVTEEDGQNVPHPVKTESLASFVTDDVADLFRDRRPADREQRPSQAELRVPHFLHYRERGQNAANEQLQSGNLRVLKLHRYNTSR